LDGSGQVKLIDFGLAKAVVGSDLSTTTGAKFTKRYAPPKQDRPRPEELGVERV
jgi:serine/threonine protein kinase